MPYTEADGWTDADDPTQQPDDSADTAAPDDERDILDGPEDDVFRKLDEQVQAERRAEEEAEEVEEPDPETLGYQPSETTHENVSDAEFESLLQKRSGEQISEEQIKADIAKAEQAKKEADWLALVKDVRQQSDVRAGIAADAFAAPLDSSPRGEPSVFEQMDSAQFDQLLAARDAGLKTLPVTTVTQDQMQRVYARFSDTVRTNQFGEYGEESVE